MLGDKLAVCCNNPLTLSFLLLPIKVRSTSTPSFFIPAGYKPIFSVLLSYLSGVKSPISSITSKYFGVKHPVLNIGKTSTGFSYI